jgi:predicted ATPase
VILFEEPESHSFPPYVRELALKIVESLDNQFFITTHSPHLFTTIVEETAPNDLAVFLTYFEDYETKFKKLETEDINEILNYGVDIFFNQKWFLNEKGTENFA